MANPVPGVLETSPSSRDYENGFACKLIQKDLQLSVENGKKYGANVDFGELMMKEYKELCDAGQENKDFGIIYKKIK